MSIHLTQPLTVPPLRKSLFNIENVSMEGAKKQIALPFLLSLYMSLALYLEGEGKTAPQKKYNLTLKRILWANL